MQNLGPRETAGIWLVWPRVQFENLWIVNVSFSVSSLDFCVTKPHLNEGDNLFVYSPS